MRVHKRKQSAFLRAPQETAIAQQLENRFQTGRRLHEKGQLAEAEQIYRVVAVEIEKRRWNAAKAYAMLGCVQVTQQRPDDAIQSCQKSLTVDPDCFEGHANLGAAYRILQNWQKSLEHSLRAHELKPNEVAPLANAGMAQLNLKQLSLAMHYLTHALTINPNHPDAIGGLALAYTQQGDAEFAVPLFQRYLAINPGHAGMHTSMVFAMHYDPGASLAQLQEAHLGWSKVHGEPLRSLWPSHVNSKTKDRKIRVGYVSGDLRKHVVAMFVEKVIADHDRNQFEVFCFPHSDEEDEVAQRIRANSDHWLPILPFNDEQAAQLIQKNEIDILVDLSGHTSRNRLPLFARKPAPIQVTWCGYFNTTGLAAMDYIIVDEALAPSDEPCPFVEKPLRLPSSYVSFHPPERCPEVGPLPLDRNGYITFGCFNNPSKINGKLVSLWGCLLNKLPEAKLVLRSPTLQDPFSRERVARLFREESIPESRYALIGGASHYELLNTYNAVDIALDTSPYNGGTTTCEALWMGVPVITLRGDRFVSRVGSSLLAYTGLSGLIATTPEEYVAAAASLANQPDNLRRLRQDLRTHISKTSVFDHKLFLEGLEDGYLRIFQHWCKLP